MRRRWQHVALYRRGASTPPRGDENAEPVQYGNKPLVFVRSVLENITGDLLIDFQGNKSGLKPYTEYPIFNSKKDCFAYYDKPWIQDGAYTKDNFYFHLDPFTVDSLDNFNKDGLRFGGELVSAGIFPGEQGCDLSP